MQTALPTALLPQVTPPLQPPLCGQCVLGGHTMSLAGTTVNTGKQQGTSAPPATLLLHLYHSSVVAQLMICVLSRLELGKG